MWACGRVRPRGCAQYSSGAESQVHEVGIDDSDPIAFSGRPVCRSSHPTASHVALSLLRRRPKKWASSELSWRGCAPRRPPPAAGLELARDRGTARRARERLAHLSYGLGGPFHREAELSGGVQLLGKVPALGGAGLCLQLGWPNL
jgi:hypothetical protein